MNRKAKRLLVLALVGVVGMAFRVSWNALRDVAHAIGADSTAALLYPFVVDGLMALALIATLVLVDKDRTFALRVLAGYTVASLLLNYVHGLLPALHDPNAGRLHLAEWAPANWALVLLATSLPVGSIFFGSDLVARVLHHQAADALPAADPVPAAADDAVPAPEQSDTDAEVTALADSVLGPVAQLVPAAAPEAPAKPKSKRVSASTGARPRRSTGKIPAAAAPAPRTAKSMEELIEEGRVATIGDNELSAEKLRRELRIGAPKARAVRDALQKERDELTSRYGADEPDPRHGLHVVSDNDENLATH